MRRKKKYNSIFANWFFDKFVAYFENCCLYLGQHQAMSLSNAGINHMYFKLLQAYVLNYSRAYLRKITDLSENFFFIYMNQIEKTIVLEIKEKFAEMQEEEDLLELLNYVRKIAFRSTSSDFTLKQLRYYRYSSFSSQRYATFEIKKKSGGIRQIMAPCKTLKYIQTCLNLILQTVFTPSPNAMGFIPQRSIATNAQKHIGQLYIYNMDLKDFFPSIEAGRVFKRLQVPPFDLPDKIASYITDLCCHPMVVERISETGVPIKITRNVLPQGAPTSPMITNIICERMDFHLSKLANSIGVRYTRYADDITFSSMHNVYQENNEFLSKVRAIINEQGFVINEKKTRLQKRGGRQEVTGLVVSDTKINVTKKYVKNLRKLLYCWERYGEAGAKKMLKHQYDGSKCKSKKNGTFKDYIKNLIKGKLLFLKMVKGDSDTTYKKLLARYDKITGASKQNLHKDENPTRQNKQMHHPKFVVECLKRFSKDGALKYATHEWDKKNGSYIQSYKTIDDFKKSDNNENDFQEITKKFNSTLGELIEQFVFGKKPDSGEYKWGQYGIKIGYGYPKEIMEKWLANNKDRQPYSMPLKEFPSELCPEEVNGKILSDFGQIIEIFKNEIEFRGDALYELFANIFDAEIDIKTDWSSLEKLKGISFYTSTQNVKNAIEEIFKCMKSHRSHGEIEVNVTQHPHDKDPYITIEILNVNSYCNLDANDVKLDGDGGSFSKIKSYLQSLCDWSIESNFNGHNYRIVYLDCNNPNSINEKGGRTEIDDKCRGFKYILKFYK